jgi:DNA-binding transcriptional LysR family regulator
VLFSRVLSELVADGMRPAMRLRSLDRDATLTALDEGELDLAVGFLPRVRRWHQHEVLYEEGHICLFNPHLLPLPVPVPIEAFATCGHIVPSLRGEMTSFVDEVLGERGLRRRVVATTAQFMAIPMILKAAPAIATLPARFAHFCANAAALATSPLPFPSPTFAVSMVWHRRDAGSLSIAWLRGRIRAAVSLAPELINAGRDGRPACSRAAEG